MSESKLRDDERNTPTPEAAQPLDVGVRSKPPATTPIVLRDFPVREAMTKNVVCVGPDLPLDRLIALFLERGVSGAPVVDAAGRVLGMITKSDLLRVAGPDALTTGLRSSDSGFHVVARANVTVGQVMTPFAFTVSPDGSVAQAAALMAYEGIDRLVVVDADGGLKGIISGVDILRVVALSDGYVVPDLHEHERQQTETGGRVVPREKFADVPTSEYLPPAQSIAALGGPGASARTTAPSAPIDAIEVEIEEPASQPSAKPNVVMIVDDDAELRNDLAEILSEEGYAVVTAANGHEALTHLRSAFPPSLILLDLHMPVMNGWLFSAELSKDPVLGRIPIVLLSGTKDPLVAVDRMNVDGFLAKPVSFNRLIGTVEQYCT